MLFLLLTYQVSVFAIDVQKEFSTIVGTDGASSQLTVDLSNALSSHKLKWQYGTQLRREDTGQITNNTSWELVYPATGRLQIICNHNLDHYTSDDAFRLINKNNFTENSYFTSLQSELLQLGFLRQIPFKNKDVIDAIFVASAFNLKPLSIAGFGLKYAGNTDCGTAEVLQACGKIGSIQTLGALGWQTDSRGEEHRGALFEIKGGDPRFSGDLVILSIDPGFISPLAKTNKHTPNRRGWQLNLSTSFSDLKLQLKLRRHQNSQQTRNYNQLVWQLCSKQKETSLEWRIEPTSAFIIRFTTDNVLFQFDPINQLWRNDLTVRDLDLSFRLDAVRWIIRLECTYVGNLDWRLIGKYDFIKRRSHYFIDIRKVFENTSFQLKIGEYDKGNLAASFNLPPSVSISWTQKF